MVFDGYKSNFGQSSDLINGIHVIFTGPGDKADDFIMRIVKSKQKSWTVVSSDREIVNNAWRYDCVSVTSGAFEQRLFQALDKPSSEDIDTSDNFMEEDDDDYEPVKSKKGSPRTLSKKKRIVRKILNKL